MNLKLNFKKFKLVVFARNNAGLVLRIRKNSDGVIKKNCCHLSMSLGPDQKSFAKRLCELDPKEALISNYVKLGSSPPQEFELDKEVYCTESSLEVAQILKDNERNFTKFQIFPFRSRNRSHIVVFRSFSEQITHNILILLKICWIRMEIELKMR